MCHGLVSFLQKKNKKLKQKKKREKKNHPSLSYCRRFHRIYLRWLTLSLASTFIDPRGMSGSSSQSTRTSPGSYSATQRTASISSGSSPPQYPLPSSQPPATAQNAMSTDLYTPAASHPQTSLNNSFSYPFSPIGSSAAFDGPVPSNNMRLSDADRAAAQSLNGFGRAGGNLGGGAILMRKLPRNTSREALRSMLLFAKDFIDADFVPVDFPEDTGFLTAVARFNTMAAAEEARALLHGKPNSKNDANMVVDVVNGPMGSNLNAARRNTIDYTATRGLLGGVASNGPLSRQSSRFNGTFQSLERLSATGANTDALPSTTTAADSGSGSRFHNLFSPQSPIGNGVHDLPRVSGKSMIDQDPDEETGELLKDPVGYAENGHSASVITGATAPGLPRRSTNPQFPVSRFANLSLSNNAATGTTTANTNNNNNSSNANGNSNNSSNMASPPLPNYGPGSGAGGANGASARMSVSPYPPPTVNNGIGGNHGYHYNNQHNPRHSLPAANPNDLNPPCNTLYVGNLPPDTSEEELKALFSKQRGYKRLCFRNKQNGPMCFVEFDEVAMASKALNDLYGYKLSNSVKTGIRLSFSKNPLGVRSGQPGSMSASNHLVQQGSVAGGNNNVNAIHNNQQMFSSVSGPPPGLAAPPGLMMPLALRNNGPIHPSAAANHAHAAAMANNNTLNNPNAGLGIRANGMNPMLSHTPPLVGGGGSGSGGGVPGTGTPGANVGAGFNSYYPDYMMGR